MKTFVHLLAALLLPVTLFAQSLTVREISYEGTLAEHEARFVVDLDLEATGPGESALTLFEGEVAVLTPKLPTHLRLVRENQAYRLVAARAGRYRFKLDLVAKITRQEPWNRVSLTGPEAAIASVTAQAAGGAGVEVQLLTGTLQETTTKDGVTRVRGFLGPERTVALRWQSQAAEVARKALLTCETMVALQVTPTVMKYRTDLRYEILQGQAPRLLLRLPTAMTLTKLQGAGVRDWTVRPDAGQQLLTVEFLKPVEKSYALTLLSEQALEGVTGAVPVAPPQPLEVERETGALTLTAEDVLVETESATGLRQVNATAGALAAYQWYARPFTLALALRRIEPVILVADRVSVRVEDARLLVTHGLTLNVEKAGIYAVELTPQPGLVVVDVRGDAIEDWRLVAGKLAVTFSSRLLGSRGLEVQLERSLAPAGGAIDVLPLRVTGAVRETAQIGAASGAGIQLKTVAESLTGVRELAVNRLPGHRDETLAYQAEQADWRLALAAERLAARSTADVFNLVTIGDGLLGGSATIRYAILNQGVQEFRVRVPARWKNVEFTGPNIRRKEQQGEVWVIGLQEKAWGGYTLVVTYDFQFDPHKASLAIGGIHCENVERETGSVAITTAANLQIREVKSAGTAPAGSVALYRVDETELAGNDRALITRPILMAYRYAGRDYELGLDVNRFEELPVLDAAADRTQLTTVLTEAGQVLSQASFMVKNNDRQFQTFSLPAGADFWSCYVDAQPVKPERNGDKLLVPLPRRANRDQAFAVDIVYAQKLAALNSLTPRSLALAAPQTDMQTTYAEWEWYVPPTQRLMGFGGNMTVARGTTYGWRDAWQNFTGVYDMLWRHAAPVVFGVTVCLVLVALVLIAIRRGWRGVLGFGVLSVLLVLLAGMLLPALSSSREKARRTVSLSNLRQIGLGLSQFSANNAGRLPASLEDVQGFVGSDKVFVDPTTGERYSYVGAGRTWQSGGGDDVVAYSRITPQGANVLYSDGRVTWARPEELGEQLGRRAQTVREVGVVGVLMDAAGPVPANPQPVVVVSSERVDLEQAPAKPQAAPGTALVAGIRPLRIDIPKTGQRFVFTKVLNVRGEPLHVSALTVDDAVFRMVRGAGQTVAFLAGLALVWWQARRVRPSALALAVGVALALGAVLALLLSWRALHVALIVAVPVIALLLSVAAVRWLWRKTARDQSQHEETPSNPLPPVIASLVLLLVSAGSVQADTSNAVSILSATYTGTVRSLDVREAARVGQFEALITLQTAQDQQTVRLFGEEVAVQEFAASPSTVKLVRAGKSVSALVPRKGPVTLRLKFIVRTSGDGARRQVGFNIPGALTSRVQVTLDEPDALVEAPTAVAVKTSATALQPDPLGRGEKGTLVEAVLGAGERVELNWTPRMKRAADVATTVFCNNTALVTFAGGAVNVRAVLDYQVTQGELRQLQVKLPAGQRLMRVEGESLRTWKLDGQLLSVELVKGVAPSYRLTVETEKVGAANEEPVELPQAVNVQRETGIVALKAAEELSVSVAAQSEVQKVDIEEFGKAWASKPGSLASVYRFLKPGFKLVVRVEPVQPQVEAVVRNHARITTEQLSLQTMVDYTIKRAGVFTLRLAVPEGYRVDRITGAKIAQWVDKDGQLEVTLKERTLGDYQLRIDLTKSWSSLPPVLTVTGVQPLGTQKLSGFVSVSAEEGVQVKTDAFEGVTEVPAALVTGAAPAGGGGGMLGFKFIPSDAGAVAAWKLSVATEKIESWVRAEVASTITLSETLVSGRSLVRYDVANAPTKEFRVRIPAGFRNVEVTGANIRRKDHDEQTGEWRVELQSKVRGTYQLQVTWDMPWNVQGGTLELVGVEAPGTERETGWLALVTPARLGVTPRSLTSDLLRLDARDLPEWAPRGGELPVLAFRYLRPGFKLGLATQRFDEAEVLQALVDNVRLTTVISEDGQMMTELTLAIRNNGRQFLEITLPPGTTNVWSAFVGGEPVRPSVRSGRLLLPMERSSGDATVPVEVTFVGSTPFPTGRGLVKLAAPALDVPLKNARWDLYLPPDYRYDQFAGTMRRASAPAAGWVVAASAPAVHAYSWSDYKTEENRKQEAKQDEVQSLISNVRSQIASGNIGEANRFARRSGVADAEYKKLSKDLQQLQAHNFVQAQRDFVANNAADLGKAQDYDQRAAEQQVAKVQAAQEVTTAKATPLRVNLPKRGVALAFTQVLQTEVNEPMSVEFAAAATRGANWPSRVVAAGAAFALLYALAALWLSRRQVS